MSIKSQGGIFGRNPTFNDVTIEGDLSVDGSLQNNGSNVLVDTDIGSTVQGYDADTAKYDAATAAFTGNLSVDSTTLYVDATNNRVGIGTATPSTTLEARPNVLNSDIAHFYGLNANRGLVISTFVNNNNDAGVRLTAKDSTYGVIAFDTAGSEAARFTTSGNLAFPSGQGIDFSATAGTGTSELFSDYEEGSFTPVVEGATTAGTATYPRQGGLYTKIGNRVFVVIALVYNTHTGTGNTRITGLPYTVRNTDANRVFIPFYADNLTITGVPIAQFGLGQTYINVKALENGSDSNLTIDAAATLYITGSYEV